MEGQRRKFIGGNWKSNNTLAKSKALVENVINKLNFDPSKTDVVIAPIALHIPLVQQTLTNQVQVATQNISKYGQGAFTGELSAEHVLDLGLKWTILGHSERRNIPELRESDEFIAEKTAFGLSKGLSVIYCIGELLSERENNSTFSVLEKQLNALKAKVNDWSHIVLAYEPVWAIGTGKTATPEQAQEVHYWIREWIKVNVNEQTASHTRIIYGGSVTKDNCKVLFAQPDVDGFLVGGASLKEDFLDIVGSA